MASIHLVGGSRTAMYYQYVKLTELELMPLIRICYLGCLIAPERLADTCCCYGEGLGIKLFIILLVCLRYSS